MSKVFTLALSFLRETPTRTTLTSLAIVASTCIVLWVVSGYDTLLQTFDQWANLSLGKYELSIAPIASDKELTVPPAVLADIRQDDAVAVCEPFWLSLVQVKAGNPDASKVEETPLRSSESTKSNRPRMSFGGGPRARQQQFCLMATPSQSPPFEIEGEWVNASEKGASGAVLRADTAERLELAIGDSITLFAGDEQQSLTVIGILHAPALGQGMYEVPNMQVPALGDVMVTPATAEKLLKKPFATSFLGVALQQGADITKMRFSWATKLSQYETPVQFQEAYEIEEALDEAASADNVRYQSYAATTIALFVSLLTIYCSLTIGVTERVRQLAVLRAIAFTKSQIAALILIEALITATIGFVGGLVVGTTLLMIAKSSSEVLQHHLWTLGRNSLILAALSSYGAAILASIIPIWRATRVRPIDAMCQSGQSAVDNSVNWKLTTIALLLLPINPLLATFTNPETEFAIALLMIVGFATMALGLVLLTPTIVLVIDRYCSPAVARLLRVESQLLESQISTSIWRTTGAALAMAFGLGLFIGIQVWGFTMLSAFVPGKWAPDAVLVLPTNLADTQLTQISSIEGIDEQLCLPIVVEQPRLQDDITGSAENPTVTRQDNVVIVGIDPQKGFADPNPLFQLTWDQGNAAEAVALMKTGNGCIVPDHFLSETGLRLGDEFVLVPPENPEAVVKYKIAASVRLTGWHWQTKLTGFRTRTHRAAAIIFARYERVATDFGLHRPTHLWLEFSDDKIDPESIQNTANDLLTKSASPVSESVSMKGDEATDFARIVAVTQIRATIQGNAQRWIWGISFLPMVSLLITGLAVFNVIQASVRARQWELGLLRSIGFSGGTLFRMIMAEGILIGMIAGSVSIAFGILAGWCGCKMAQHMSFFGGLYPSLYLPWLAILLGIICVLLVAAIAALQPARSIAAARPLKLLQSGRSFG